MSDFDTVFKQFKDNTKPMCELMGCPELVEDFIVDVEINRQSFKSFYEAGQQSKQAEIDNLQKRVKELELINFDSELHFDAAKEHIVRLKSGLETLLKSYKAQSCLPMSDEYNRGWVSAFACVHNDLKILIK